MIQLPHDAHWVWPAERAGEVNQYVEFRHEFDLAQAPGAADLLISADADYAAWLNGQFVDCGQLHSHPGRPMQDELPVTPFLRAGRNVLCILVHHQGVSSFQYAKDDPGLLYVLKSDETAIVSGEQTRYRFSPAYRCGPLARVTPQLGFTFEYDARGDDGWTGADYVPGPDWVPSAGEALIAASVRPTPVGRPVKRLTIGERERCHVAAQGIVSRQEAPDRSVAELMQIDFLASRAMQEIFEDAQSQGLPSDAGLRIRDDAWTGGDGVYLLVDLGREEAGLLDLDVEASAGTVIDIAHGEHLEDLRVRARVGLGNFADRYICRAGRQQFIHRTSRLAGRYLQLQIASSEGFALHYAGLRPTEYPVARKGSFACPDSMHNRIHETAVRTLHLCMHEHYEDCPWREQSLYSMDSVNQALSGYYCFGEYDFPAASIDLLGRALKPDGFLELCAPGEIPITIPSFTLAWVLMLRDHLLYSGNADFARGQLPVARQILETCSRLAGDGLLPCPVGARFWHFYEWAPGLDGTESRGFEVLDGRRYDAPLNLFYCLALKAAAFVAASCGEMVESSRLEVQAGRIAALCHETFWNDQANSYVTRVGDAAQPHYAELTQSLAILAGACTSEIGESLRRRLAAGSSGWVPTTLSHCLYKFEALLVERERYGTAVFSAILRDWGSMIARGATSFWETIDGAAAFGGAGSLCHGWSGIPVYFQQAYLLGIKPAEPGFRSVRCQPVAGAVEWAEGTVPTPHGPIRVRIESHGDELKKTIHCPPGITIAP